jgi:hypothetical protein
LQTVTTVGYGDVTPANTAGRVVGALFLLEAISFVTIVTAVITSSFVERARQARITESETAETVGIEKLAAQLSDVTRDAGADPANPRLRRIRGSAPDAPMIATDPTPSVRPGGGTRPGGRRAAASSRLVPPSGVRCDAGAAGDLC